MKSKSIVAAIALVLSLALPAQSAKADFDGVAGTIAAYTVGGLAVLTGITGGIGNAVYLGAGERSPIGWQVVAYTGGGLTVLGGAVLFGLGVSSWDGPEPTLTGLGATALALGAAEIVITILADQQPEAAGDGEEDSVLTAPRGPSYGVAPLIVPQADAPTTYGLSFSIQGF